MSFFKLVFLLAIAALAYWVYLAYPDIRRYLRIRSM